MPTLFDPIRLGAVTAPNRILMAPMTRGRATRAHVPTLLMVEYYRQRATAGLIISEGTGVSQQGLGWPHAPGIWSDEQVEAWGRVTAAVHHAGGRIFVQLWHMGRLVHPDFLGGAAPVAPSATRAEEPLHAHTYEGTKPYVGARALTLDEIAGVVEDHCRAARNALAAGFDGVQLHGANGYLVDQFLRDGTNRRTDGYGGPVGNRLRFLIEVTRALVDTVGADRTAVRLSPNDEGRQGAEDSDNAGLYPAAAAALDRFGLAFLEMNASKPGSTFRPGLGGYDLVPEIRSAFSGPLILNQDYGIRDGAEAVASAQADGIAFGRHFIANPDLPARLRRGDRLDEADEATFYTRAREGYVDYPAAV